MTAVTSPRWSNRSVTGLRPLISRAYRAADEGVTPATSLYRPTRGHSELFGQFLVGILRQDQAGDPQDRHGVLAGRPQHADRVIGLVMGHDEPVVVGQDDVSLLGNQGFSLR